MSKTRSGRCVLVMLPDEEYQALLGNNKEVDFAALLKVDVHGPDLMQVHKSRSGPIGERFDNHQGLGKRINAEATNWHEICEATRGKEESSEEGVASSRSDAE